MRRAKYRVWLLRNDADSLKYATRQRFYRVTPEYILVYTRRMTYKKSYELKGNELNKATNAERAWLMDCNMAIIAEETKKHEVEIAPKIGDNLDALEEALEKERRKLEEETANERVE